MKSAIEKSYGSLSLHNGMSKNKTITAKVSPNDLSRINEIIKKTNSSKSAFIREAVLAVVGFLEQRGCECIDDGCGALKPLVHLCKKLYTK